MRKKNQKEELSGSPGCSGTLPGFIVDETHAGQGVAPTPYHLLKKVDQNSWIVLRQPGFFRSGGFLDKYGKM